MATAIREMDCNAPRPDPIIVPTDAHPRWRLRVFDRCWPWRATRGEALRDAVLSRNARRDVEDRVIYLDAVANIQRDPPHAIDQWRVRCRTVRP